MSTNNQTWYLMARCLNNEASKEEYDALRQLLSADAALCRQYELLQQFWGKGETYQHDVSVDNQEDEKVKRILHLANTADDDVDEDLQYSIKREGAYEKTSKKVFKRLIYISAAAACIAFFFIKFPVTKRIENDKPGPTPLEVVAAQNGTRTRTILPDGSVVLLNSGSKISYEGDFKGLLREVTLDGEAFFDVVKNSEKPFIVHASNVNIKVLGTAFNVKSYSSDSATETTLIRGLVQVSSARKSSGKVVYLHPNEKIVVPKKTDELIVDAKVENKINETASLVSTIDTTIKIQERIETSWVYNRLVFRGETFKELAGKLERWYNIKIEFTDEKAGRLAFSGSFENETVEEALAALQEALPFTYKINDHTVFIGSAK